MECSVYDRQENPAECSPKLTIRDGNALNLDFSKCYFDTQEAEMACSFRDYGMSVVSGRFAVKGGEIKAIEDKSQKPF